MTKGLQQIQFLNFAILCKELYRNSVVLGSINQISHKLNLSDHQTRKQVAYGLRNKLIFKIKRGYIFSKYSNIINNIDAVKVAKHYHFYKKGTFKELTEYNLFVIAKQNFIQQQFRGNQSETIRKVKKLATAKTERKDLFTKKEYSIYQKGLNRVLGENFIVTGQKHLCKLLNISQGLAARLLSLWANQKLFFRTIMYSSFFDKNNFNYSLNTAIPKICIGSKISLIS